jgi:RluA family pseudouridine synthase
MACFKLCKQDAGRTVLEILSEQIPAAPRSYLRQLLRGGKVHCGGKPLTEDTFLQGYETLQLPDSDRLQKLCAVTVPKLTILLETETFLAVFKPAGLAVHSSAGHTDDNLTDRLRAWMHHRKAPYRIAPAHRLDIGTSGPVLFGKGRKATAALGKTLQSGEMRKIYLALVHGCPPQEGIMATAVRVQGKIKQAATRFRVQGRHGNSALLELELLSGRKHQIRQQCSEAGWPIYGDSRYGGPGLPGLIRLFLHCRELCWSTETGKSCYSVSSPLPEKLCSILRSIQIDPPSPN